MSTTVTANAAPVEFVLSHFNTDITMSTLASIEAGSAAVPLDVDATAVLEISREAIRNVFTFQSDSFDVDNVNATDIHYFVNMKAWPSSPALSLNPALAMMNHSNSLNGFLAADTAILANKKLVKHDFLRYLAKKLFNTEYGVDLFNNETQLLKDLRTKGQTNWETNMLAKLNSLDSDTGTAAALINDTYSGGKCTTDDFTGTDNICRELFRQILGANQLSRFRDLTIDATTRQQPVPIEVNDSISFKFTVNPAADQEKLTGLSAPIPSRSYRIRLNVVAGVANNTVEDATENA